MQIKKRRAKSPLGSVADHTPQKPACMSEIQWSHHIARRYEKIDDPSNSKLCAWL
jgi:hypothetical protein